jgi:hypothetical protein
MTTTIVRCELVNAPAHEGRHMQLPNCRHPLPEVIGAPETLAPYWQQIAASLLAEVENLKFASDPDGVAKWVGRATSTLAEALRISEANTPAPTLHQQRLEAVRQGSPAVQDGPYAYIREDQHMAGE